MTHTHTHTHTMMYNYMEYRADSMRGGPLTLQKFQNALSFPFFTMDYSTSHCITTHHIANIYLSIDLYVKQDHHNLYAHSLSFIICFIYNRTENSDAHFGTFLMKTMQAPINNLHRKHLHQSSSIIINHHPTLYF